MPKNDRTILIVEDDEVLLRALYLKFHGTGYTIASATDGESALQMVVRIKPDLVLLDLLLPKVDGFEVLRDIRANPEIKSTPVIILSNLGDKDDVDKANKLGANDYFIKANTDLSKLEEKIKQLLK